MVTRGARIQFLVRVGQDTSWFPLNAPFFFAATLQLSGSLTNDGSWRKYDDRVRALANASGLPVFGRAGAAVGG